MSDDQWLVEQFEAHRGHLRAVAYRMTGSLSDAEDALQETWLRLSRSDTSDVENLRAWLTTVIGRVCLNMLRARNSRRAEPVGDRLPDPVITADDPLDPERDALVADSVGLALLVVLETLTPAERVAFVLHDIFAVPFDEIAPMVGRTPTAARQLASRARRRVQGTAPVPDGDPARQRAVVDAFFAAARNGDFEALVALLDPDVVARADVGRRGLVVTRGAESVARRAVMYANPAATLHPALINGAAGVVVTLDGRPFSILAFTVVDGRIIAIDSFAGDERLRRIDLSAVL
ncbi:MAG TPA: sigma-70 family RNA polymerase sigma factor [Acidimicrobiales bacterium]